MEGWKGWVWAARLQVVLGLILLATRQPELGAGFYVGSVVCHAAADIIKTIEGRTNR